MKKKMFGIGKFDGENSRSSIEFHVTSLQSFQCTISESSYHFVVSSCFHCFFFLICKSSIFVRLNKIVHTTL